MMSRMPEANQFPLWRRMSGVQRPFDPAQTARR